MKFYPLLVLLLMTFGLTNCKKEKSDTKSDEPLANELAPINDSVMETAIIYEANIRQYSEEGSFNAFTKDIPQLKELGVKIIWLMPVHPISMVRRKATPDLSIEDITDEEEKKKYLGSYYAVADYKGVNPEFGTEEDLKKLIQTAHDNGMYVILDWVANHTGFDHKWITEHPEFYTKNAAGEITDPMNPETGETWGWTDVADLDYSNKALWDEMASDMKFWLTDYNIDGFRCDVAGEVPTEFWEFAVPQLKAIKPVFMLAESEEKSLFINAFDMGYNWEGHHIMNDIAQGKKNVSAWDEYMVKVSEVYQPDDILMSFVTNHDENSWNGTVEERMGEAGPAFLALTYAAPGMPLIYSGQEYDMNHRLKFFEKDQIPKTKGKVWPLLQQFAKLRLENNDLNGGKKAASYQRLSTSNETNILAFKRGEKTVFLANLSKAEQTFTTEADWNLKNLITGEEMKVKAGEEVRLKPWQYGFYSQQ